MIWLWKAQSPKHERKGHFGQKKTEWDKCRVNKNEKPCQGARNVCNLSRKVHSGSGEYIYFKSLM